MHMSRLWLQLGQVSSDIVSDQTAERVINTVKTTLDICDFTDTDSSDVYLAKIRTDKQVAGENITIVEVQ